MGRTMQFAVFLFTTSYRGRLSLTPPPPAITHEGNFLVFNLQAAHVGVGISGQEGLQAASASDYAIAQVRIFSQWYKFIGVLITYHISYAIINNFPSSIDIYLHFRGDLI